MRMTALEKKFVNSPGHSQQVTASAEKLLRLTPLKAGSTYLDVGCGNGAVALAIARKYAMQVTGVDVDPAQIKLAQAQLNDQDNARFLSSDALQLPFEDGEFDLVSSFKMTHHIPAWGAALAELLRVVKPGGYLVYVDLNFPRWVAAGGGLVLGKLMGFPTTKGIDAFLAQNGVTIQHRSTLGVYKVVCQKP